jgi:hypothetical protein
MDGALLRTDVLAEGMAKALTLRPWALLGACLLFPLGGRPAFKRRIAHIAPIDAAALPYREAFLEHLRSERARGRRLLLATAADAGPAEAVAAHLGLFDAVLASDGRVNRKGRRKAEAIEAHVGSRFAYAGDSAIDLQVWRHAQAIVLAGASGSVMRRAGRLGKPIEATFPRDRNSVRTWLAFLQPTLTLPAIAMAGLAGALIGPGPASALFAAAAATASLVGMAGLISVLRIPADRARPPLRANPFASGALPVHQALIAAAAFLPLTVLFLALLLV